MAAPLCFANAPARQYSSVPSSPDPTPLRTVAFSVAEAALESVPNSPLWNSSMNDMMDMPALADAWESPSRSRLPKRSDSAPGRGQPLWEAFMSAKERRRERQQSLPALSETPLPMYQDVVTFGTSSADQSPVDKSFSTINDQLGLALRRLTALDLEAESQERTAAVQHIRTQPEGHRSLNSVLRAQAMSAAMRSRPVHRMPSLAQIQAKMTHQTTSVSSTPPSSRLYRSASPQDRSDSVDSADSEGPQTPTDEVSAFDIKSYLGSRAPMTPDSPCREPRLAPFLRERINDRLISRPYSPPTSEADDDATGLFEEPQPLPFIHGPSPRKQPNPLFARPAAMPGTPSRETVTFVVTPPQRDTSSPSPASPTDSVTTVSSTHSLPIITCTPCAEPDSEEESEGGDVIVFGGEEDEDIQREHELELEREKRGREMRFRLLARRG